MKFDQFCACGKIYAGYACLLSPKCYWVRKEGFQSPFRVIPPVHATNAAEECTSKLPLAKESAVDRHLGDSSVKAFIVYRLSPVPCHG